MTPAALARLHKTLEEKLADKKIMLVSALNELTLTCLDLDSQVIATLLRDDVALSFEQCIDICGIDYYHYPHPLSEGQRFATITHLLSIKHNLRLRMRVFAKSNTAPTLPSLFSVWNSANWFEREIFDLYGIVFEGHPDLRRILTDYGFTGHPFRKDFPQCGHVEAHYDQEQQKIVYRPITVESRELIPPVIREEQYGG